jgi:hypothetical protein
MGLSRRFDRGHLKPVVRERPLEVKDGHELPFCNGGTTATKQSSRAS